MLRQLSSAVVKHGWVRKLAVSTPGVRDLAWRFVAGEDLDAAVAAVRALDAKGIRATVSCVGTHVRAERDAAVAADAVVESIHRVAAERLSSYVSVKLTKLGLDVDEGLARAHVRRVLDAAKPLGVFVRIDMEEAPYVDRTIVLFEELREAYGADAVGIVIQSYLRGREGDLERLLAGGSRIRLVKGGYWEAADVVYRSKPEIDAAFLRDLGRLLRRGRAPAIATHDPVAIDAVRRIADEASLARDAFELQMLYGVRPDLQEALARDGYEVRAYVPYGSDWYDYFLGCMRRLPREALDRLRAPARSAPARSASERRA